jgi:hypothetical protein
MKANLKEAIAQQKKSQAALDATAIGARLNAINNYGTHTVIRVWSAGDSDVYAKARKVTPDDLDVSH